MCRSFLVLATALLLGPADALPVSAVQMCSGRMFGTNHLGQRVQNGTLASAMNRGMHQGFSGCMP
jgi:hypothetical protein